MKLYLREISKLYKNNYIYEGKNISLKISAQLFILLIFIANVFGSSGDNRFVAFGSFSTQGLETKSTDKFHWKISYERSLGNIPYISLGFRFFRSPKGNINFIASAEQWEFPVKAGFLFRKKTNCFNFDAGLNFAHYTLTGPSMILHKNGFEIYPSMRFSWRKILSKAPVFIDLGSDLSFDFIGGLPISIDAGGGIGFTF